MSLHQRWALTLLKKSLESRKVTLIAGARQTGKSTLAQSIISSGDRYYSLDNASLLKAAKEDPMDFVKIKDSRLIIDEIQRAPELLMSIKFEVDQSPHMGRYLITGSADLFYLPSCQESLAGRVRKITLRPLTQAELRNYGPNFLQLVLEQNFPAPPVPYSKEDYLAMAFKGGFPSVQSFTDWHDIQLWHRDYLSSVLSHDLQDVINIRRTRSMNELTLALAAWSSKFLNFGEIGSFLGLSRPTLESYINALHLLFLVESLNPWPKSDYDRIGRQEKIFYVDSGLMSSALNWSFTDLHLDGDRSGKLLETFVYNQLIALCDHSPGFELYHYRDRQKREIDFLISSPDGTTIAIEVKSSSTISIDAFKHIIWFRDHLNKGDFMGIVLYTGQHCLSFGPKLWALPMSLLFTPDSPQSHD